MDPIWISGYRAAGATAVQEVRAEVSGWQGRPDRRRLQALLLLHGPGDDLSRNRQVPRGPPALGAGDATARLLRTQTGGGPAQQARLVPEAW